MEFLTNEKLTIVGAAGMIGSNMAQTALMMRLTPHLCLYDPYAPALEGVAEELRHCADIVSTQIKNDEVILKGEIPARCIQEYRNDLTYFTNGQGVCLTELKGYQPATGKLICQPRRPNSRIDKVRHMFHKLA